MIASLQAVVQDLAPAFTEPSFLSHCQLLLGWVMCLGRHTEYRVAQAAHADSEVSRATRHPFDRLDNFFSRSAWQVNDLARAVALSAVTRRKVLGALYLVVDDTLLHKRGLRVFGLGWFRDAVASTRNRVATASGNNWVVLALAVPVPLCPGCVFCIPLAMRLHLPGHGQPSCASLAREMLEGVLTWSPGRDIILIADAAYACQGVLEGLPPRVPFVGRMRGDAAVYDPTVPPQPKGKRGPKPKKGPRLLSPRAAAKEADGNRSGQGPWAWQAVEALAYGVRRGLKVLSYTALWPHVLRSREVRRVVVRDPDGKFEDAYRFTTALAALPALGDRDVRQALGDRAELPRQQAGPRHPGAPARVPGQHREAGAVGVAAAGRAPGVVRRRRAHAARGQGGGGADGALGQPLVVAPRAPGVAPRHPQRNN